MPHLLVLGSPIPTLSQGKDKHIQPPDTVKVCMAAIRSGGEVSLFCPRPDPIPDELVPLSSKLTEWDGPVIHPAHRKNFKISMEAYLAFLPADLYGYDGVYVGAMDDTDIQLSVFTTCHARGARMIFSGLYLKDMNGHIETIKRCFDLLDVIFIHEVEAKHMFGSTEPVALKTGQIAYITMVDGSRLVVQGDHRTHNQAVQHPSKDIVGYDPIFSGAVTAGILLGCHPVFSALKATALAVKMGAESNLESLFEDVPPPHVPLDARVRINADQVEKCAQVVKTLPEADPFNFASDFLPPVDHPHLLDYFFAVTLQQFSFWEDNGKTYTKPLIAPIDGKLLKGSSYLYQAYTRQLLKEPLFFTPERQAGATEAELLDIFRADDGSDPMPAFELHLEKTRQYGKDMLALGLTPEKILTRVGHSPTPLRTFSMILNHIGGYKEDPIRKKTDLLAMCLDARPEKLFQFQEGEAVLPVVDYHCMRACLRMGLIEIVDAPLKKKLTARAMVTEEEEWAIRYAAFLIQEEIMALSGKAVDAVHWFFFNYTRTHCPEMSDPICADCAMDGMCAHRKEMFQPVYRTTFY
jgi:hypothetical protein